MAQSRRVLVEHIGSTTFLLHLTNCVKILIIPIYSNRTVTYCIHVHTVGRIAPYHFIKCGHVISVRPRRNKKDHP